jgi:ABC-type glycerol-3-phosphate transport system substrate-binding protein
VTQTAIPTNGPRILRVWLPPQFDPNADNSAAKVLRKRLDDFEAEHRGVEIEVRIKAEEGDSSLINSLVTMGAAAPTVLPDLVALSNAALESAASKGLLHPIDGLSSTLDSPDWFGYARQMGHIQNTGYGLPFAGDTLVLVYRSEVQRITTWNDILASKNPLVFAAGDPNALVGLSLYVSAGGQLLDGQGHPTLNQDVLQRVLTLISDGLTAGIFSGSLGSLTTDEQVVDAYKGQRANMAIFGASRYRAPQGEFTLPLPGLDEPPVSFATGWAWALAGSNAENQQLAAELADYLVADDFLGSWVSATGYLPTRPSAVEEGDTAMNAILESAQPMPSSEVLTALGSLMQEALVRVLNGEKPEVVAQNIAEKTK